MKALVEIKGVSDILKTIEDLPDDLRKNARQNVLRAGAKPILKAAKANAAKSKRTGQLVKSIGISTKKVRRGNLKGQYTARVGPRNGFSTTVQEGEKKVRVNPTKYAHFVEYGTSKTAAKPFIRPAIDSAAGTVIDAMAAALDKHIDRALKRRAKKNGLPS